MLAKFESVDDILNLSATRSANKSHAIDTAAADTFAVPANGDVPISFDAVVVAHADADQGCSLLPSFIFVSAVHAVFNKSVSVTDDLPIKISRSLISKFNLPSAVRKVAVSVSSGN